jgi:hydrogenase maturation protease
MMKSNNTLLLALGNDIMGDDAVGLHVARALRDDFSNCVDVVETPVAGFALLDLMAEYESVLIVDAVCMGDTLPGTIREFTSADFSASVSSSPHYVGLPDMLSLAERLGIPFPQTIRILTMEVRDPFELREGLSEEATRALPSFIDAARNILHSFALSSLQCNQPSAVN